MYKDSLFKLIRNEEVILWAGSGMSIAAGFPSGSKLRDIIYNDLSLSEKEQVNPDLPLQDLSEEYYRIKGNNKNSLIKILLKNFVDVDPENMDLHNKLVSVPHIRTIVTTNYDTLFETAYGKKSEVIYNAKHIPHLNKNKVHIYKVHGDFAEPDSIILTRSDYNNFFKDSKENNLIWTSIKQIIASKNILFVGYNLEDFNVSVIFDRITETLGDYRKECYLAAPNLPTHKANDLIKKNIHYLNTTAEILFDELIADIEKNITTDLENGLVSPETLREFLNYHNIKPTLKAEDNSFKIASLHPINGELTGNLNLKFREDDEYYTNFNEFVQGKKFGKFEIDENNLQGFEINFGKIKLPNSDKPSKITLHSVPKKKDTVCVRFEDGFEMSVHYELYSSPTNLELHVTVKNAFLFINIDAKDNNDNNNNAKYRYEHAELCSDTKSEIETFSFLKKLFLGQHFTIFFQNGEVYKRNLEANANMVKTSNFFIKYFSNLKVLENKYSLRFSDIPIDEINSVNFEVIQNTVDNIENGRIIVERDDEIQIDMIDMNESGKNYLENLGNVPLFIFENFEENILIHSTKIILGFRTTEFPNCYVSNLAELNLDLAEQSVAFRSRNKHKIISYTDQFIPQNIEGAITITVNSVIESSIFLAD